MDIISSTFLPDSRETMDESVILDHIMTRVGELLREDVDLLMSYLYRLDIDEVKIQAAFANVNLVPLDRALGQLILDRQMKRVATKKKYKQEPIEGFTLDDL